MPPVVRRKTEEWASRMWNDIFFFCSFSLSRDSPKKQKQVYERLKVRRKNKTRKKKNKKSRRRTRRRKRKMSTILWACKPIDLFKCVRNDDDDDGSDSRARTWSSSIGSGIAKTKGRRGRRETRTRWRIYISIRILNIVYYIISLVVYNYYTIGTNERHFYSLFPAQLESNYL